MDREQRHQDPSADSESSPGEREAESRGESGQVSEVSRLDPDQAGAPIYPDQATAGYPDSESGAPDEGTAGPNARPHDNRP